jgi:hypothetical protein
MIFSIINNFYRCLQHNLTFFTFLLNTKFQYCFLSFVTDGRAAVYQAAPTSGMGLLAAGGRAQLPRQRRLRHAQFPHAAPRRTPVKRGLHRADGGPADSAV